jgi:RHS repeat-associated protein
MPCGEPRPGRASRPAVTYDGAGNRPDSTNPDNHARYSDTNQLTSLTSGSSTLFSASYDTLDQTQPASITEQVGPGTVTHVFTHTALGISRTVDNGYGTTAASGAASDANRLRWIGGYQTQLGNYLLGYRQYNTTYSRFTQPDPTGQEPNSYAYGQGDPINNSDPAGSTVLGGIAELAKAVGYSIVAGTAVAAGCTAGTAVSAGVACLAGVGAGVVAFGAGLKAVNDADKELVVLAAVFTLLRVSPDAGQAVDVISTVLMVAGGVVLVGALIVLLRNRRT